MSDIISVLTFKSVDTIIATGGTQSWVLDRNRAAKCDYVVVCRNASTREAEGPEDHGTAFLVGKIKDVVPSTETKGRWLILISEFARIDVADQWEGRNPVAYYHSDEFPDINFKTLKFESLGIQGQSLTLAQAKAGLALHFNVSESNIDISIHG